jgi:hypothetical protein
MQAYVDACEAEALTRAIRVRAQSAWLAIKDAPGFEPSPEALQMMEEVMRPLQ